MKRRDFLRTMGLAAGAAGVAGGRAAAEEGGRKPNVLIVMGDDVTYTDLACYGGANVKTPNIDRFATEGVLFRKAYLAMAMCAPCRQELYSGLYPMRSGATWNHSQSKPGTKSVCH
ncbi:MAG: sulfatase-like hydrolase/transferase, partial [Planctomycetota bacterium]